MIERFEILVSFAQLSDLISFLQALRSFQDCEHVRENISEVSSLATSNDVGLNS